jgi:serine acetyltransferase
VSWWTDFKQDMERYEGSPLRHQGLWALFQYRIAHAVYRHDPESRWLPLLYAWRKMTEIATGMSLPHGAELGPGLVLGHLDRWSSVSTRCVAGIAASCRA